MKKPKRKYLTVLGVKSEVNKLRAEMEERFTTLRGELQSAADNSAFKSVDIDLAAIEHKIVTKLLQHPIFRTDSEKIARHALAYGVSPQRLAEAMGVKDSSSYFQHRGRSRSGRLVKAFRPQVSILGQGDKEFGSWKDAPEAMVTLHEAIAYSFAKVGDFVNGWPRAMRMRVTDEVGGIIAWQHGPVWFTPSKTYLRLRDG